MNQNGNIDKIRQRAKKATLCSGTIDVWYLPYTPMMEGVIFRRWNTLLGDAEWDGFQKVFVVLDCAIVDVVVLDGGNEDATAIATYWEMRGVTGSVENFDLFAMLLTNDIVNNELWVGYNETRAQLPEAPEETRQAKPEKDSPLGKRGKKRTEPTG